MMTQPDFNLTLTKKNKNTKYKVDLALLNDFHAFGKHQGEHG